MQEKISIIATSIFENKSPSYVMPGRPRLSTRLYLFIEYTFARLVHHGLSSLA